MPTSIVSLQYAALPDTLSEIKGFRCSLVNFHDSLVVRVPYQHSSKFQPDNAVKGFALVVEAQYESSIELVWYLNQLVIVENLFTSSFAFDESGLLMW